MKNLFTNLSINHYAYAFNNPLKYTNPSGEIEPILVPIIAGAIIGGYFEGISGTVSALINKNPDEIWQGMLGGAISGGMEAVFRTIFMGSVIPYSRLDKANLEAIEEQRQKAINQGINNPGYPIVRHQFLHKQDINLNNNILIHEKEDEVNDKGQVFHYNNPGKYAHESMHYYQQVGLGTYKFQARIFYEYIKYGSGTYFHEGTLEYNAQSNTDFLY